MCATLEREVSAAMNVRYALAVTSGTAALQVALAALGVGPGDEVITPAWGWVSCFTSIVQMGALPVLAEIDETFCLAKGEITRLKTPRTKAIIVLHYQGVAADIDPLLAEAGEIPVIEDCAQSIGASYRGRPVGSMGAMGIYSFQANKVVTSGEGGILVTNDADLYERAVRTHDLGFFREFHKSRAQPAQVHFSGAQYRMNEITAAVALAQFRKHSWIREHTRAIGGQIAAKVRELPGLRLRRVPDDQGDLCFEVYFSLEDAGQATRFGEELRRYGVNCVRTTGSYCHYARPYCSERAVVHEPSSPFRHFTNWPAKGYRAEDFPRTEFLIKRFVSLPIGTLYTDEDAAYICEVLAHVHRSLCIPG